MKISSLMTAAVLALGAACGMANAACSAAPGAELLELKRLVQFEARRSAAVFSGQVIAIDYVAADDDRYQGAAVQVVRVVPDAWWKGVPSKEVTLVTNNHRYPDGRLSREAHEFDYQAGQHYLIYAHTERGQLHASKCSRTSTLAAAGADIAALDGLKSEAD